MDKESHSGNGQENRARYYYRERIRRVDPPEELVMSRTAVNVTISNDCSCMTNTNSHSIL